MNLDNKNKARLIAINVDRLSIRRRCTYFTGWFTAMFSDKNIPKSFIGKPTTILRIIGRAMFGIGQTKLRKYDKKKFQKLRSSTP